MKKFSVFLFASFCGISLACATPPSDISISYDPIKNILHISAHHPTDRMSRHYLRTVVISKNGTAADTKIFSRQSSPSGIEEDIAFEAIKGDKIGVVVSCSQGGSAEASTTVQ